MNLQWKLILKLYLSKIFIISILCCLNLEFTNYLDYEDSKLHTIKNKIFRTSWWLLRFMRKNYKPITKEEIRDFDREFVLEIEGNNYDEPVLNEVKDYLKVMKLMKTLFLVMMNIQIQKNLNKNKKC